MYIDVVPNRNSPPAVLLRQSYRQHGKVRKRTLANLTGLPKHKIEALRQALRTPPPDDSTRPPAKLDSQPPLRIVRSLPHGHVQAVLAAMQQLGLPGIIAAKRCRQRDLVLGMIAARILFACSKLNTISRWSECTLTEESGIADADENDLYEALDWLRTLPEIPCAAPFGKDPLWPLDLGTRQNNIDGPLPIGDAPQSTDIRPAVLVDL